MSILSSLAKSIGASTLLPIVEEIAVSELHSVGHDVLVHATTIPHSTVDALVHKFGSDHAKVGLAVDTWQKATVALVESFAPSE